MNLLAILQCSDLHFGEHYDRWWVSRLPLISGYASHDRGLCAAMCDAVDDVGRLARLPDTDDVRLLVCGDLTVSGHPREFSQVENSLQTWTRRGFGANSPLAVAPPSSPLWESPTFASAPGNHDQWDGDGVRMWAYNPRLAGAFFASTPGLQRWRAGDLELEVASLDSSAGLDPGYWNWFAFGNLDRRPGGEVERLRRLLRESDAARAGILAGEGPAPMPPARVRLRALVVHHSPSLTHEDSPLALTFEPGNKELLLSLAEEFQIHALLTGHTHDFGCAEPLVSHQGWKVWEIRSANATQGPVSRKHPKAAFWAHKIWLDDQAQPHWHCYRYFYHFPKQAFLPHSRISSCLQILP